MAAQPSASLQRRSPGLWGGTDEIVSTKALQAPAGPAGKGCANTQLLSTALPHGREQASEGY